MARPSLNRSISAVSLVQTRYAPLHNYHVTVCRRSGVTCTRYCNIGTQYTLKWFVYRPVAAQVQIQARRRSSRSSANFARGRSAGASSGQWIIVELARTALGPPVRRTLFLSVCKIRRTIASPLLRWCTVAYTKQRLFFIIKRSIVHPGIDVQFDIAFLNDHCG